MIYAEWYDAAGVFRLGEFETWDAWHAVTWNPDVRPLYIKDLQTGRTWADPNRPMPVEDGGGDA